MAQIKPASSRAMATTTWFACVPRAIKRRERVHSRPGAFQLMSWMGLGWWFEPQWQMPTDVGGIPVGPGPFDQGASGVGVTGCGDRPLPAALTTGICCGDQAQICHQWPGVLDARQVAELRHEGHGHGARHATQGLKGLDHRLQSPGCDLFRPCLHQALEPCGVLMDRAHVCLEDDWWSRGGADHFGEPPQMGRAPGRATRRAEIVAEPQRL